MHKVSYDIHITKDVQRFPVVNKRDSDSSPIFITDNIGNFNDKYSAVYNDDALSEKRIFSKSTNNNKTIIKTNTLDIAATDKVDLNGIYLFNKVLIKKPDFDKILINKIEHTVYDSSFVYTNLESGTIDYIKNNNIVYTETIESLPVFIDTRCLHLANIISIDNKTYTVTSDTRNLTIAFSKTAEVKIKNTGSMFSSKIRAHSIYVDGFFLRKDIDENTVLLYDYASYIPDVVSVKNEVISKFDRNQLFLRNRNILPESIKIKVYKGSYPVLLQNSLLFEASIDENERFFTSEIRFLFDYINSNEFNDLSEIRKVLLPASCVNSTDGSIIISLEDQFLADDVFITVDYSFVDNRETEKEIVHSDIIDMFVSPTMVITNGDSILYDKNLIINNINNEDVYTGMYTYSTENHNGYDVLDFTTNLGVTESNITIQNIDIQSQEVSPEYDYLLNTKIGTEITNRFLYNSNILNICTLSKTINKDISVYINNNLSTSLDDIPPVIKNFRYNILHRSITADRSDPIVAMGINKIDITEGIWIDANVIDKDNTYIYVEFKTESLINSNDTIVMISDQDLIDYVAKFNVIDDYSFDKENLAIFIDNNDNIVDANDPAILLTLSESNTIVASIPVSYTDRTIGMGILTPTIILPKVMLKI